MLLLILLFACDRLDFSNSTKNIKIDSLDSLKEFINDGMQHSYFPTQILSSNLQQHVKLHDIDIEYRTIIDWKSDSICPQHEDQIIVALADQNQSVQCGFGDTVILSGPGDDWIDDSWGNDIIYPGSGNDTINAGHDNDIVIFDKHWGQDTLTINSEKVQKDKLLGYEGSYPWEFSSFIIFAKGISRKDIAWKGKSLVNIVTGDTIKLNTKNINILFASDQELKKADHSFIPQHQEPEIIQLEQLNAESVLVKDNMAYYAKGNDGLYIVDLTRLAEPTIVSKTSLPGRAMSVKIDNGIAYVSQADSGLEGKKGWLSILDIHEPQSPQVLSTMTFGSNVYNVAVAGKFLYVPESHFQKKKSMLHIYDISKPKKPKELSVTTLKQYTRYIDYLDETLYLSRGAQGIQVFDVENPKKPQLTAEYGLGKERIRSFKIYDNKIVVNKDDSHMVVLAPTKDKKLQTLCRITTQQAELEADISPGVDSIQIRDNMVFRAEGRRGVTVTDISDIQNCQRVASIPIDEQRVGSVYIIKNTLVAFNDQKRSTLFNLDLLYPDYKVKEPQSLMANEADKNIKEKPELIVELSQDQLQTLLYKAASNDDAEQVALLCSKGAKPNEQGHDAHNPIEISAMLGKLNALQALLECPGKPTGKSMMRAALNEQIESMKLLERYGGNIAQTDGDGCTTLHYIAQDGTLDMVKYLVTQGVPVDAKCRGGETALKWAHFDENTEVIEYLNSL